MKAKAVDGIYLLLEGGWASQTGLPSAQQINAASIKETETPTAIRGGVGYNHDFNRHIGFGVEVAEGRFGETAYQFTQSEDLKVSSETVEFLSTLTLHIKQFDLTSKIGGLRLTPDPSGKDIADGATVIDPEAIFSAAFNFQGNQYPILRHVAATLSFIKIFNDNNTTDLNNWDYPRPHWSVNTGINAALLGIRYTFGP